MLPVANKGGSISKSDISDESPLDSIAVFRMSRKLSGLNRPEGGDECISGSDPLLLLAPASSPITRELFFRIVRTPLVSIHWPFSSDIGAPTFVTTF